LNRLLLLPLLILCASLVRSADVRADVTPSPRAIGGLPYTVIDHPGHALPARVSGDDLYGFTLADTDGDGYDDLVINIDQGLVLYRHDGLLPYVVDQMSFPPDYVGELPFVDVIPYDGDGDGREDVVAVAPHRDGTHWRLWVTNVEEPPRGGLVLPAHDERRFDGRWDGSYLPVGELPIAGRERTAVLIVCSVLYDVHGRGLLAVDPVQGTIVWRRFMDAKIRPEDVEIVDLDQDGRMEILATSVGVNNLHGERIYGASDDSSRVFVLDDLGETLWQRALAGRGSGCTARAVDLDDDGVREVAVGAGSSQAPRGRLTIWSARGELRFDEAYPDRFLRPLTVAEGSPDRPALIAVDFSGDAIEVLRWSGRELVRVADRKVNGSRSVHFAEVVAETPGPEILVRKAGRVEILDRDLRRLAGFTTAGDGLSSAVVVWDAAPDLRLVQAADDVSRPLQIVPAPRRIAPAWLAGGSALALGAGTLIWNVRRRRRERRGEVETDPVILRELRLQLLARLAKGSHEKIGALQHLRRLAWRLQSEAVKEAEDRCGGPSPQSRERVGEAVVAFRRETAPRLDELLVLARRIGAPDHLVVSCEELLAELDGALERVTGDSASDATPTAYREVDPVVSSLATEIDAVLQRLRRNVEQHFRGDLGATVARVLEAQDEAIEAGGIEVEVQPPDPDAGGAGPLVAIDPQDLEFVLDNLVGNAIRAMGDSAVRRLIIAWRVELGRVTCTVADSGCGIAPDDWQAIFEDGWSSRPGGGYGLARSRKELAVFGGTLRVAASEPGQGTTLEMGVPVARDEGSERNGGA
jgi:signal transduction histidine kinase